MLRRFTVLAVLAFAAVALLAGCGGSSSPSGSPGSTEAGSGDAVSAPADCRKATGGQVTLRAKNIQWDTACLEVTGTSLTVNEVNEDQVDHPFEVKGLSGKTDGKPGKSSVSFTDLKPGKYGYICTIHPNMTGTLYVEPASSAGAGNAGNAPTPGN